MKAVCPECSTLVEITPTGQRIADGYTASYWRIVVHAVRGSGKLCSGSTRLV